MPTKRHLFETRFFVVHEDGSFWSEHKTVSTAKKTLVKVRARYGDAFVGVAKIALIYRVKEQHVR